MVNRELIQAWVDALRSGGYTQCFLALKAGPLWNPSYCAIGVLGEMTGQLDVGFSGTPCLKYTSSAVWSPTLADMTGMENPELWYGGRLVNIAALNDTMGLSFNQIADLLEQQYLDSSSYSKAPPQASSDGVHTPSPATAPTLQEVGLSDSPAPVGSDSSAGERAPHEAEEEEMMVCES